MKGLSCLLNFKENLTKNLPYYELLARQVCIPGKESLSSCPYVLEHTIFCTDNGSSVISRVCEGYQFTVAFSGRLFNAAVLKDELSSFGYPFLVNSDAELALLSYIHFGDSCSHKLSGDFSLIIYDSMRRTIFALSKGFDALPLFYAKAGDFHVLSTSINGIFSFPYIKKRITGDTVMTLLSASNRIPSQIFDGVSMLPADSFIKITQKGIQKSMLTANDTTRQDDVTEPTGLIFTESEHDYAFLRRHARLDILKSIPLSVYAEKFSSSLVLPDFKKQHLSIDEGSVLNSLETAVSACGFPFLSSYDYILPIALKRAKGSGEKLFFASPDRFFPQKNYTETLIKNESFHYALDKNMQDFVPGDGVFPSYSSLISNSMSAEINSLSKDMDLCNSEDPSSAFISQKLKTTLRRILLDIISKENAPLLAFFKRSALLRLCEGGFVFGENESETELTAYLIKLNMWFEIYSPRII